MYKTLAVLILLPFAALSQSQKMLQEDYNFPVADLEVNRLTQVADTLYELNCYADRACRPKPSKYYKILSSERKNDFTILKMERLDPASTATDPHALNRYYVTALMTGDKKRLGYLPLGMSLTKKELDNFKADADSLKEKFFYTYFSESYLKELSAFKKISTRAHAEEVLESFKDDKFKAVAERFRNTRTWDMYGTGFTSEILNRACIDLGYNPLGAGSAINELTSR